MLFGQHAEGQLIQAAPNVYLVGIMVSRRILAGFQFGNIGKVVGRAATGSCIQTIVAAIGFQAIKPDQPGTNDVFNFCDFSCRKRWLRGVGVGADTITVRRGEDGGFRTAVDGDIELFADGSSIWGRIGERYREIFGCLHIKARGRSRRILVTGIQNLCPFFFACRHKMILSRSVTQQVDVIRQRDGSGRSVGWILHLHNDGHDGIVLPGLLRNRHG